MAYPFSPARVCRPLPGRRAASQPALAELNSRGISIVGARGDVASESVAQILADRDLLTETVWLRLEALDAEPHCLVESLHRAAAYAGGAPTSGIVATNSRADAFSHAEAGRLLAETLGTGTIVVLEDTHSLAADALGTLISYIRHADPEAAAIYLSHGGLRRRGFKATEVGIDSDSDRHFDINDVLLEDDAGFSASSLAQLISMVGHPGALLNDILDANTYRDSSLVTFLAATSIWRRSLLDCVNERLLPSASPSELQALSMASHAGYWHPSLGDRAQPDGMTLRPWMLPLESGWWWLRPTWRRSLQKYLDPAHRLGRRFFAVYRSHREDETGSAVSLEAVPESGSAADVARGLAHAPETGEPKRRRAESEVQDALEPAALGTESPMSQTDEGSTLIVDIRLLGTFEVIVGGRPVTKWHGRLGRSILAYLLVQHQRSAVKDRLLEAFWPDVKPTLATNRLHVAVSSLRKSLRALTDRPVIEFNQDTYQIARGCAVQVDVDDFEQNVRTARRSAALGRTEEALALYEAALECYRGDLLPDMPYEEWTLLPREALRVAYVECLGGAARLHMSREEYGDALRLGWAILATDPAHEEAHRLIMRCHASTGQPHQALRHFEICRRELATILGVEPAQATVDLLDAIRREASTTEH